jgi:hypothetical protein
MGYVPHSRLDLQHKLKEQLKQFNRRHSLCIEINGALCINPEYEGPPPKAAIYAVAGRVCSYCRGMTCSERCTNCGAPRQ